MKLFVCFLSLVYFLFFPQISFTQTVWKSDGSIIVGGVVKKKPYSERYKEELKNPSNAWRHAKFANTSIDQYFGNGQLLPGIPLLRMSAINKGEDYIAALSKKNGFTDKSMLQRFLISSASPKFLEELGITEDEAIIYASSGLNLNIDSEDPLHSLIKKFEVSLSSNVSSKIEKKVDKDVKEQLEKKVEEQIEDQVEEAIEFSFSQWWDNYIQDLIDSGATIIYRSENRVDYTYDY